MNTYLDISPEVKEALEAGRPVVALESTIISHGMPYPKNVETALLVEQTIRDNGAVPATIAVIGGALDCLYPPENKGLADEIAAHGAVISEFPMGRAPNRTTFVWRNRLVSGLSKAVLVVEASAHSGAMQTAHLALEQDRGVMAVPGRVDLEGSQGPHQLIKEGAKLVENLEDILREFEFLFPMEERRRALQNADVRRQLPLSPAETAVLRALWREGEADQDDLSRRTGLSIARLLTLLMQMEMKRFIRRLPRRRVAIDESIRGWEFPDEPAGAEA